ncbi:MAG: T9SS type A sorting domain-containing protein [Phaeodactylibacter sp.]|nr:T9SS type A sorting domain-containing protein [Phaeodactylibacter sp.]MCB9048615.1 T9SS type A sorting domain-containing protein [Lewinellaceae bacterium]
MRKTTLLSLFLISGVITAQDVKILDLKSNDLVYLPSTGRLYVSTPEGAAHGNSLCVVNPGFGTIDTCYAIGGSPGVMAVSDDEKYIYIGLTTSPEIVRFDLENQAVGQRFSMGSAGLIYGPNYADDIAVMPGAPKVIAVSMMSQLTGPRHTGVAVFDDGVQRPNVTSIHTGSNSLAFDPATGLLYGYNNESSEFGLRKMAIDANGVSVLSVTMGLFSKFGDEIEYAEGKLYSRLGQVIDISGDTPTLAGQFDTDYSLFSAGVEVAPDSNVVYFMNSSFSPWLALQTYDKHAYNLIGEREFLNLGGIVHGLVSWGGEGKLAFLTKDNIYNEHNHLVILRNCTSTITTAPLLEQPSSGGCIGDTLALQAATGVAGPVFWPNGQTGPVAVVTTPGEFWYQVADEQGCLSPPSNSIFATFEYPAPQPYIQVLGPLALCQGGQVTLSTPLFPGYSGFLWNTGETGNTLAVTEPGEYSVQALSFNGCPSEPSLPVTVYSLAEPAPPQPAVTVVGETVFCDNMPSLLQAPEGYPNYFWNNGDQSPLLVPYVSGEYSVQVMNEAGCLSPPSVPVSITVNPSPPVADIFLSNDNFLYTSAPVNTGLQWLLNGEPIPGANSQVLGVTETGLYSLQLTWEGCSSVSNELYVLLTGTDEQFATEKPILFPNPSSDIAYLRLAVPQARPGMIRIRSVEGRLLHSQILSARQEVQELALSGLPSGLYVVEAFDGNGIRIVATRLVKQ